LKREAAYREKPENKAKTRDRVKQFKASHIEARRQERRRYGKKRIDRDLAGVFVTVDCEGCDTGRIFDDVGNIYSRIDEVPAGVARYREHHSFLWAAGNDDKLVSLVSPVPVRGPLGRDQVPLSSLEIMDWLCSLPAQFPKFAKFISFGFGYDVTQLVKGLPFDVAREIQHKKPFAERTYPSDRQRPPSLNHIAIWKTKRSDGTPVVFGINYLKGKWIKIGRMADPDKLFKRSKKREYDYEGYFTIFDVCQAVFLRKLARAKTIQHVLAAEAEAAGMHWRMRKGFAISFKGNVPGGWCIFQGRVVARRGGRLGEKGAVFGARHATHPLNAMLNYGYAVALAQMTRAIVGLGLDPCFGFLHSDKPI
jgi:CRISPR associated protein Cas1